MIDIIRNIMENIKFIHLEEILANSLRGFQEEEKYWKKYYPHIFYPLYDLKKFNEGTYADIFKEYFLLKHHENVMIHNNLYNYLSLGKSFKETYEFISDKYGPKYQENERKKNNANKKVFVPNHGLEKYIKSFDFIDRAETLQMLENYKTINEIFLPQFCALIFVKFEEYLKQFAFGTVIPEKKIKRSDEFAPKKFDDKKKNIFSEIDEKYKRLPTMLKYGKMIDKNCRLEGKDSVEGLLKKNRFREFNRYRNCVIHSDPSKRLVTLSPLDCFNLQKEILDFIYSNDKIISTMKGVYNRTCVFEWLA